MKKPLALVAAFTMVVGMTWAAPVAHGAEAGSYKVSLKGESGYSFSVKGKGAAQRVAPWGGAIVMYCYEFGGVRARMTSFSIPKNTITKAGRARISWGNKLTTSAPLPPGQARTPTAGRVDLRFTGAAGRTVSGTIDLRVGNCYATGMKVTGKSTQAAKPKPKKAKVASKKVVVKGRTTKVKVRCPKKPKRACKGTLVVKHKKKTLAKRKYAVKAGKAKVFKVKVTKKGKRILSRQKPRRVRVVLNPGKGVKNVSKTIRVHVR